MDTHLPDPRAVPELLTEASLCSWLGAAAPGDRLTYFRGALARSICPQLKLLEDQERLALIAACWRPILMLTFGLLIVARWLGWSAPGISEAEALKLWNIVEIGLGGYVIGRSAEKTLPRIVEVLKR